MLFKWAYGGKLNKLNAGYTSDKAAPFWDKLVFGKVLTSRTPLRLASAL